MKTTSSIPYITTSGHLLNFSIRINKEKLDALDKDNRIALLNDYYDYSNVCINNLNSSYVKIIGKPSSGDINIFLHEFIPFALDTIQTCIEAMCIKLNINYEEQELFEIHLSVDWEIKDLLFVYLRDFYISEDICLNINFHIEQSTNFHFDEIVLTNSKAF